VTVEDRSDVLDLRAFALGLVAWTAAFVTLTWSAWWMVGLLGLGVIAVVRSVYDARSWPTRVGWLLAASAVAASAYLHLLVVTGSPVARLAHDGASVQVVAAVTTAPVLAPGRFADRVYFDATVTEVAGRGERFRVRAPVLVLMNAGIPVERGAQLRLSGMLRTSDRPDRAGVLTVRGTPVVLAEPDPVVRGSERVRAAIRDAVATQPTGPRALVPALVDGDDANLPDQVAEDFQTSGLTHLQAVSGTNLTLIVGSLLLLARWVGVRARALLVVGAFGVVGFVLLAGPEPSVLRAAAMGTVALIGLGTGARRHGIRALGIGILGLLLVDPWLARSWGFALSVVATAGILLLVPPWRDALVRWLPRWAAEAVAVPLAAQIACTPLVAALSGQVSLVAVFANVLAAPLVAPATVLGLAGGLVGLVWGPLGRIVAAPAAWSAAGIIAVAEHAAGLSLPAFSWSTGASALLVLTGLCGAAVLGLHAVLARRDLTLGVTGLAVVVILVPLPTPGWPPPGWLMTACSVGQGDALVLNAGARSGVVVDAGPDPGLVDSCLRRLGIKAVPVLVLTHFHADHVDGLAGVLRGRRIGRILTSPLPDPEAGAAAVRRTAERAGVAMDAVTAGATASVGPISWEVLAPGGETYPDSDSPPNDASVVMLVEIRGIRILLTGDQERPSQAALRRSRPGLRADVLKVAHHGSSKQDVDLIAGLGARLAVISVGEDNDYGHPAGPALDLLARSTMAVRRTDQDGDIAVVLDEQGRLGTVSRPGVR